MTEPKARGRPRRARRGVNAFTFTRAQREVLEYIEQGLNPEHIGKELGVGIPTVQTHITRIASKLPPFGDLRGYPKVLAWILTKRAA